MSEAVVDRVLRAVAADVEVDRDTLAYLLVTRPAVAAMLPLLSDPTAPTARAALIYLGMYGGMNDTPVLVLCLQHRDEGVARLAEQCVWGIWMKAGSDDGNATLRTAVGLLDAARPRVAARLLRGLTRREPEFAEAHFQLGLALHALDQPHQAAIALHDALDRNTYHFAACTALGHVSIELGDVTTALEYYRRALTIHPRLADARAAFDQVCTLTGRAG